MNLKKQLATLVLAAALGTPAMALENQAYVPALSLAAGILNQGVFPSSDLYTTDDDIVIYGDDGINLEANIFVPTALNGPAPAIVFISSWGLNEYEYLTQAGELAEKGYIVLSYTARGFSKSGGQIDTAGPNDISDLSNVLDYLIANYPVDPNAVGVAGISYGSGIGLIGAAQDDRIRAVSAMSTWGDLEQSLYGNQTPRLVWGELLTLTSELLGNPDPIIAENWNILKDQDLEKIPQVREWASIRSPINYVDELNQNNTAVYIGKAYGDNLFQPNSVLDMFSQLTGPRHMDILPGTHATAELIPPLLGTGDMTIWDNTYDWFDLHLKGETNAIAHAKPLNLKIKLTDRYESFDDYPIPETRDQTYYLHPRGPFDTADLETYPFQSWWGKDNTINAWKGSLFSTQIPALTQILEQASVPTLASVYLSDRLTSIYFESDRLSNAMKIRGTPSLSLQIQPKYDKIQLVAYLYDMDRFGTGKLITHGVMTLPVADNGKKIQVDLDLVSTAYDVPAGHKVVLAVDTKDPQYLSPTDYNYFVDFEFSNRHQSVLKIPVL